EQATGGNATAGVLNVAYDANAQVTDAIVRHQLSEHAGMGVWADVFYAKNEAKEIYGDFGYSADIYGGVLGFDYTAACGGTLGAALTVGTADADSEGGVLSNSLSSDFVGLSVYASKDFSGLNVKADLGYIDFSNDFTGLGDASDATTITFGVRGDFTAYQNGAFSVVPHMGLRYTRIDTDAVAFNDEQNMNVLEAPIGVKFAGTFEATGWKLVPSYDFTIVPQLGDKEVEAFGTAGDITILSGGLFNNVLGVEAVKDNMSFGLNASYGFGPDDRANTQVNANFRYNF
ncbi:autotransporter beta-domain protein, partial [Sutterella sp. KLE1602]|uniref:autotransporter outer membrane beta-barrel domain-containing protein n=1 Tax=Sutterella sp. KLE1602 TaxID=1574262 RepID=UPI000793C037